MPSLKRLLVACLAISSCAFGQTYTIRTFAGGALPENVQASFASLGGVRGSIAADGFGNLFIPLPDYRIVVRMDAFTGVVTRVAGNGTPGFSGDNGPATSAQLNAPQCVALDSANNLYIGDGDRIRKVSNGLITTVAGGGTSVPGDDGPATSARLGTQIFGLVVDSTGNLYIADTNNNRVRRVSSGVITTVAGTGAQGFGGDNSTATLAQLNAPYAVTVDSAASLYIADSGNNRIRKVTSGMITTVAGNGTQGFSGDNGSATTARLFLPTGVAVDSTGNIYIADANNNRIRKVSSGVITTVAGNGVGVFSGGDNGPATNAQVPDPHGIAVVGASGDLYIADLAASVSTRIRKVSSGVITTFAGAASQISDNGPPTSTQLSSPWGVAVDSSSNLYIADTANSRIRRVSSGLIATVAGNGTGGFSGDFGPPPTAQLGYPLDVATDSVGSFYIADTTNNRVRKISGGVITTVAGNGTAGFGGDNGPATSAQLNGPTGVVVDSAGNLYIADSGNHRIRIVSNSAITTIAGSGTSGFSGDNGPATSAQLSAPQRIAVDSLGNLYIADMGNNRIRKVSNGLITTVAGGGTAFPGDNVPATSAQLVGPRGVAVDSFGHLYIPDQANARIRKVSNGVIATIAGGTPGFSGDNGPAVNAQLNAAGAIAVDTSGNVYVSDVANQRVRVLIPSGAACSASVTPNTLSVDTAGSEATFVIRTDPTCAWAVQGLPPWITYSGNVIGSGMAIITLTIAANSGGTRTAIISVAGVSVLVTQQGGACSYAITPGGQAWPAAGGSGTVNISAATGCQWTAASTLSWVTITTNPASGSGNGTITYQVAANTGDARTGNLTIAGLAFSVEQASAITNLSAAGSMAHLASAGYWKTTITLVNTGAAVAQARLNFLDNNGNPLMLALSFPPSASSGALVASTVDRTLNPGAGLVIESTGPDNAPTLVGSVQLLTNGSIGAFGVFRQQIGATNGSEAVVPFETRSASTYALWFDNTNGLITGVAVSSVVPQPITVGVTIRDDTGAILGTDSISLAASGHTSYSLVDRFASTAQRRGTIEFSTPAGGQISVLGIRFSPQGGFSTIPVLAK